MRFLLFSNYGHALEGSASKIHGDEEQLLGRFERESFDAVVSCLSLHWLNDLPGTTLQ